MAIDLADVQFRAYTHEGLEEEENEEDFVYPTYNNKSTVAASSTIPIDLSAIKFRAWQDEEQDPEFEIGDDA